MTTTSKVHVYDDKTPGAWDAFIAAMQSGEVFECDEDMFMYWLEVLPPVWMHRTATLPNGEMYQCTFGFAEGAENVVAFWRRLGRFFGCRTNEMNRGY